MLMHRMLIRFPILLAVALGLVSVSASAEDLYRWTSGDGTVSFTDDAKRVPQAYQGQAQREPIGSLTGFSRFTPMDDQARSGYELALDERLAHLRALNAGADGTAPQAVAGEVHPIEGVQLQSLRRVDGRRRVGTVNGRPVYRRTSRNRLVDQPVPSLSLPVDPGDPAPVVMEERRVLDGDSGATRHVTVIQQGDRVLGVIKPFVHAGPTYTGSEEELERGY